MLSRIMQKKASSCSSLREVATPPTKATAECGGSRIVVLLVKRFHNGTLSSAGRRGNRGTRRITGKWPLHNTIV